MSKDNRHSEDERKYAREQIRSHEEEAAEIRADLRVREEQRHLYEASAALTPPELHPTLRALVRALPPDERDQHLLIGYLSFADPYFTALFLEPLRTRGLVDAVLRNVDMDGWPEEKCDPCWTNWVPHRPACWPVIRHVLANPERYGAWELEIALRSAPVYATAGGPQDREDAVRLLTEYLREDSPAGLRIKRLCPDAEALLCIPVEEVFGEEQSQARACAKFVRTVPARAAIGLSKLAPDTPGLAEVLGAALHFHFNWVASTPNWLFQNQEGSGAAAEAIQALGPRGRAALPALRAAILKCDNFFFEDDFITMLDAYAPLSKYDADGLEIHSRLENLAVTGRVSAKTFQRVTKLPGTSQEYGVHVSRLIQARHWGKLKEWGRQDEQHWAGELPLLKHFLPESEALLPAYAAALEWKAVASDDDGHTAAVNYAELSATEVRRFLGHVSDGSCPPTDGNAFVATLRGRPPGDLAWLVYADWLEERGEPQAELIRLRHALAPPEGEEGPAERAELGSRQAEWLAAHGPGWATLFDLICEPPPG